MKNNVTQCNIYLLAFHKAKTCTSSAFIWGRLLCISRGWKLMSGVRVIRERWGHHSEHCTGNQRVEIWRQLNFGVCSSMDQRTWPKEQQECVCLRFPRINSTVNWMAQDMGERARATRPHLWCRGLVEDEVRSAQTELPSTVEFYNEVSHQLEVIWVSLVNILCTAKTFEQCTPTVYCMVLCCETFNFKKKNRTINKENQDSTDSNMKANTSLSNSSEYK